MRGTFQKVSYKQQESFVVCHDLDAFINSHYHHHPELELIYILKGEGILTIANNSQKFRPGEMFLLGANMPHSFIRQQNNIKPKLCETITLHFSDNFLGNTFLNLPEASHLSMLFTHAQRGLQIGDDTKNKVVELMFDLLNVTSLKRILLFLEVLGLLANCNETSECKPIIEKKKSYYQKAPSETGRLEKIYQFTHDNYKNEILLKDVASLVNLSTTSFCRYFKNATAKSYYDFLLQVRIDQACRLLLENDLPAEQICFACGFNNSANFYRQFKKITGVTPLHYRKQFIG